MRWLCRRLSGFLLRLCESPEDEFDEDYYDEMAGPSTYTCTDCGHVVEVWRNTEPFDLGDQRMCEHSRDLEEQVLRINTLRY
jgi:hypothetical protein